MLKLIDIKCLPGGRDALLQPSVFVDASDLGLSPGEWPTILAVGEPIPLTSDQLPAGWEGVTFHRSYPLLHANGDIAGHEYRSRRGKVLHVAND